MPLTKDALLNNFKKDKKQYKYKQPLNFGIFVLRQEVYVSHEK